MKYAEMIETALKAAGGRKGLSLVALKKYMSEEYPEGNAVQLRRALKSGVDNERIVQNKGHYKLPPKVKAVAGEEPKAKKAAPKKAAATTTTTAKKAAPKKAAPKKNAAKKPAAAKDPAAKKAKKSPKSKKSP